MIDLFIFKNLIFQHGSSEGTPEMETTTQIPTTTDLTESSEPASNPIVEQPVTSVAKDMFSLYSLSFTCKSKDLSERRIKLDFGLVAEVTFKCNY